MTVAVGVNVVVAVAGIVLAPKVVSKLMSKSVITWVNIIRSHSLGFLKNTESAIFA